MFSLRSIKAAGRLVSHNLQYSYFVSKPIVPIPSRGFAKGKKREPTSGFQVGEEHDGDPNWNAKYQQKSDEKGGQSQSTDYQKEEKSASKHWNEKYQEKPVETSGGQEKQQKSSDEFTKDVDEPIIDRATKKFEEIKHKVSETVGGIKEKLHHAKERMGEMEEKAKETFHHAAEKVEVIKEKATETMHEAQHKMGDMQEKAKEKIHDAKETMGEVKEKASEKIHEVKEKVGDMQEKAKETVSHGGEKISEMKDKAAEKMKHLEEEAGELKEKAKDKAVDMAEKAKDTFGEAVTKAGDMAEKAKEKMHFASEKAGEMKEQVKDKASEMADKTKEKMGDIKESASEMAHKTKEKMEDMKEGASEMAEKAKQKGQEYTGQAKEKMEDVKATAYEYTDTAKQKIKEATKGATQEEVTHGRDVKGQWKMSPGQTIPSEPEKFAQKADEIKRQGEKRAQENKGKIQEAASDFISQKNQENEGGRVKEEAQNEEEPNIAKRAAEKLKDMAEKMTGRPVYQREHYEYAGNTQMYRDEVKKEEEVRKEGIKKEMKKPQKDMFDLEDTRQWNELIVNAKKPIVVDFYRVESGDCRRLYPKLMDKFKDTSEEWVLVGANADRIHELVNQFNVEEYPTLILFHKGKVVERCKKDVDLDQFMNKVLDLSHKS